MEKSIETIWQKGFLEENALIAPKINDLYTQKSKSIMAQMAKLFKWNIIGLYGFALLLLLFGIFMGLPIWLIVALVGLFVAPALYSQRQLRNRRSIDQFSNCYDYLKDFDQWLTDQLNRNIALARYFYPLSVLLSASMVFFTDGQEEVIEKILMKYPDLPLLFGVPVYFLLPVVIIALLIGIFADRVYKLDAGLIYGKAIKKLKVLLKDLEELRG
jgi:hypothetical protein